MDLSEVVFAGFRHGPLSCRECFVPESIAQIEKEGFILRPGPGYWGAPHPEVLVLGQTRGAKQISKSAFDDIAFAGMRDRLINVMAALGIEGLSRKNPDRHFTSQETRFGFASVLRCSLSFANGKTSGSPLSAGMRLPGVSGCVDKCMKQWLHTLEPRLRLVVVLGLTPKYRDAIWRKVEANFTAGFKKFNADAIEANGVLWVVAQHPSTVSENHYQSWISAARHSRRDALRPLVTAKLKGA